MPTRLTIFMETDRHLVRVRVGLCSQSCEDRENTCPNRIDKPLTLLCPGHQQSCKALIRIVENVHQPLHFPENVLGLDLDVDRLTRQDRGFIIHRQASWCNQLGRIVWIKFSCAHFVGKPDACGREFTDGHRLGTVIGRMKSHAQGPAWNVVFRMGDFNHERVRLDRQSA